jgi:hypothetical protein
MAGKKRIHELVPANQSKFHTVFKSAGHDILFEVVGGGGLAAKRHLHAGQEGLVTG